MAANSIKRRFKELYKEVEEDLSDEDKKCINELSLLSGKELYELQNKIFASMDYETTNIIPKLREQGISDSDMELFNEIDTIDDLDEAELYRLNLYISEVVSITSTIAKRFNISTEVLDFLLDLYSYKHLFPNRTV